MYPGAEKMIRKQKKDADAARRGKKQRQGTDGDEPEAFTDLESCVKCEAKQPGNQMYHSGTGLLCQDCHEG